MVLGRWKSRVLPNNMQSSAAAHNNFHVVQSATAVRGARNMLRLQPPPESEPSCTPDDSLMNLSNEMHAKTRERIEHTERERRIAMTLRMINSMQRDRALALNESKVIYTFVHSLRLDRGEVIDSAASRCDPIRSVGRM